jgi:hypothetical protein
MVLCMFGFISDALEVMGEMSGGRERNRREAEGSERVRGLRGIFPLWFGV